MRDIEDIRSDIDYLWAGHLDDRWIAEQRLAHDVEPLLRALAAVQALIDHAGVIGDYVHVDTLRAALSGPADA